MRTFDENQAYGVTLREVAPDASYNEITVVCVGVSGIIATQYALDYAATLHPGEDYTYSIKDAENMKVVVLTDD